MLRILSFAAELRRVAFSGRPCAGGEARRVVLGGESGACVFLCNSFKGPNVAGFDPATDLLTRLFNSRDDLWEEHFQRKGPEIDGTSNVGRTTVEVLRMNEPSRVEHRRLLMHRHEWPQTDQID
jgi:hypothetical protein